MQDCDWDPFEFQPMTRNPSLVVLKDSLAPSPKIGLEEDLKSELKEDVDVGTCPPQRPERVLVCGVGYVGTHLVERFSAVYRTHAYDASPARQRQLRGMFAKNQNVQVISSTSHRPTSEEDKQEHYDLVLISVPTLLLEDGKGIDTRHIEAAVANTKHLLRPGSTMVIESSVGVGTTRHLLGPLRSQGILIGFSPERIDPGRKFPLPKDIPKVVSGLDSVSLARVVELYGNVFTTIVPVSKPETAEMCKLYENCFRMINIAYINEISDACEALGIDVHEVVEASGTKPFGFMKFSPSLGAGGHCIPVNPWYLLSTCSLPLLEQATLQNRRRPRAKAAEISKIAETVLASRRDVARHYRSKAKVLILGLGFKEGESSLSHSPAVTLAEELESGGVGVSYMDDHVETDRWERVASSDLFPSCGHRSPFISRDCARRVDDAFDVVVSVHKTSDAQREVLGYISVTQWIRFCA